MTGDKYRELKNKQNILEHVYEFNKTDNLFELAEVCIDIQKIFKSEEFPIRKYINSKQRKTRIKEIKNRRYNYGKK